MLQTVFACRVVSEFWSMRLGRNWVLRVGPWVHMWEDQVWTTDTDPDEGRIPGHRCKVGEIAPKQDQHC